MTRADLDRAEKLAGEATPGPWLTELVAEVRKLTRQLVTVMRGFADATKLDVDTKEVYAQAHGFTSWAEVEEWARD